MNAPPPVGSAKAGSAISSLRHKFEAVAVPERAVGIMAMLREAADAGAPCPGNRALSDSIGAASISTAANVVALLEGLNLIRVERFAKYRVVEIVETGARTKAPANFVEGRPRYEARSVWTPDLDAALMDAVSEGVSFSAIGREMRIPHMTVIRRFDRLRRDMGWQAI